VNITPGVGVEKKEFKLYVGIPMWIVNEGGKESYLVLATNIGISSRK